MIRRYKRLITFNSLSRDHWPGRTQHVSWPPSFNSLSRDHRPGISNLRYVLLLVSRFQLPLSGSPPPHPHRTPTIEPLSTPSLGITRRQSGALWVFSWPSFQLPLSGSPHEDPRGSAISAILSTPSLGITMNLRAIKAEARLVAFNSLSRDHGFECVSARQRVP